MNKLIGSICVAAIAALAAGCGTPPPLAAAAPAAATNKVEPVAAAARAAPTDKAVPAHLDVNSGISKQRSVYFDFDRDLIKPEYTTMLAMHAHYLVANPALAIKLRGHADERGGTEYNLALGQQRAEAVARALRAMGVKDGQLEAVSLGEYNPKAIGHDEAAWTQNRRADIDYPVR